MSQLQAAVDERYTVLNLTQAIRKRQNEYGLLNSLGLFSESGISTREVKIETKNSALQIIPSSPVGTPTPAADDPDTGNLRILPTFRHAKMHTVLAEEIQGVRKFGTDDETEVFDEKVVEKLDLIQREHRQTKEFLRWGALKGNVYDADGSRLLYNVYTEMGETQKEIEWNLDDPDSVDAIGDGNDELWDYMEDQALGETVTGIIKLCSPGYLKKMMHNTAFREAYRHYDRSMAGEVNPHRQSGRRPFEFKDVTYIRHRGSCTFKKRDGTKVTHKFIPDDEAIAVPLGTFETFRTFFGPAEFMETVNTIGQEIYVKPHVMKLDAGIELHSFSYALNLVTKPRLVVRCTVAAVE